MQPTYAEGSRLWGLRKGCASSGDSTRCDSGNESVGCRSPYVRRAGSPTGSGDGGGAGREDRGGSRAGGVPEEVPASNHWALYDRGDAASLACAVVRVLQHEDLSGAGLEAQRYVRERFDVCALSAAVESTYGDLARA